VSALECLGHNLAQAGRAEHERRRLAWFSLQDALADLWRTTTAATCADA
jgi:hypothetical protein